MGVGGEGLGVVVVVVVLGVVPTQNLNRPCRAASFDLTCYITCYRNPKWVYSILSII